MGDKSKFFWHLFIPPKSLIGGYNNLASYDSYKMLVLKEISIILTNDIFSFSCVTIIISIYYKINIFLSFFYLNLRIVEIPYILKRLNCLFTKFIHL